MIQIHVGKQHTFGADINDSGQVRKTVSCDKCHVSQVMSRDGFTCHVSRVTRVTSGSRSASAWG